MIEEPIFKNYTCIESDCGKQFLLTEGEERFFTDKGLFVPKRCPECRKKRREAKQAEMNN